MIRKLKIKNFKILQEVDIELKELNLLTGLNGSGKSSLIQSLLLLRQSVEDTTVTRGSLKLNGNLVNLRTGKDVLYQYAEDEIITFELGINENEIGYRWELKSQPDNDYLESINFSIFAILDTKETPVGSPDGNLRSVSLFNDKFQYLQTDHLSPQDVHDKSVRNVQLRNLGKRGEYAVHYLNAYGSRNTIRFDNLLHQEVKAKTLSQQVDAWLGEISPGIKIHITPVKDLEKFVINYSYSARDGETTAFSATNSAFGVSYILPVIVSLLIAEKDDIVILENPEAHLHPQGQSRIGRLMALAAQNGVQIIAETHSDHILNGIRVAVKKGEVDPDKVGIFYFDRQRESGHHRAKITQPRIDENGRINEWPKGFFDEWDNMLDELIM